MCKLLIIVVLFTNGYMVIPLYLVTQIPDVSLDYSIVHSLLITQNFDGQTSTSIIFIIT